MKTWIVIALVAWHHGSGSVTTLADFTDMTSCQNAATIMNDLPARAPKGSSVKTMRFACFPGVVRSEKD